MSPGLPPPLASWTAVSTNVAAGGNFTLTVTNAFNPAAAAQCFRLQTQ